MEDPTDGCYEFQFNSNFLNELKNTNNFISISIILISLYFNQVNFT